ALQALGHRITGSDKALYPPMSTVLEENGIHYVEGYQPENLPATADIFVVGNSISRGNLELEALLEKKLPYCSMAELLKHEVIQGNRSFGVSGTHSKNTTSSSMESYFGQAVRQPGFMLGSVPEIL